MTLSFCVVISNSCWLCHLATSSGSLFSFGELKLSNYATSKTFFFFSFLRRGQNGCFEYEIYLLILLALLFVKFGPNARCNIDHGQERIRQLLSSLLGQNLIFLEFSGSCKTFIMTSHLILMTKVHAGFIEIS